MIELQQALSSLGVALNIGNTLIDIRDEAKLQKAVMESNSAIIDAQSKIITSQTEQSSLSAKIDELEKECMRLKNWETEKQAYSLTEIVTGIFAYIKNDSVCKFENAHKYCCNCFDSNKKSTLQQFEIAEGRRLGLSCHNKCPDLIFYSYKDTT